MRIFSDIEFAAAAEPDELHGMVVYSGRAVYRYDWMRDEEYMLQLSLDPDAVDVSRLVGGPLLNNHWRDTANVIGVIEKASVENGKLIASARFSDDDGGRDVRKKIADKILRNVSVEAATRKIEKTKKEVDGLPLRIATKWEPEAVAVVPVGADRHAQLMSARDENRDEIREFLRQEAQQFFESHGIARDIESIRRELAGLKLRANALSGRSI